MKRIFFSLLVFCFIFAGCSSGTGGDNRVVAQVNDYRMSVEDLRYELDNTPYDDAVLLETQEGREEYLDRLLEKEILLQDAQRQGLDREKDFMKSIENYWEQALLKILLERKSKEISGLVHVYEDEVKEYYNASGETSPFSKVRRDIERDIRRKKETDAMNAWIEELRSKSCVSINKDILDDSMFKAKP